MKKAKECLYKCDGNFCIFLEIRMAQFLTFGVIYI